MSRSMWVALAVAGALVLAFLASGACDALARWLVGRAARRLPRDRARWDEEWRSDLEGLPGPLPRLVWALAIRLRAAPRQAAVLRDADGSHRTIRAMAERPNRWPGEHSYRRARRLAGITVLVFVAWMALDLGGPRVTAYASAAMLSGAPLLASIACFSAARRPPLGFGRAWSAALRKAWTLFGAAALCWGLGRVLASYLRLTGQELPVPSLADACSLGALPLAALGMLAYPTAPVRATGRLRTLLDALAVTTTLLFLSWPTVLSDAYRAANSPTLERVVALAYPVGDLCTATIALVLLVRARGRGVVQTGMLALAVLSLAVSDSAFAYLGRAGAGDGGSLANVGWLTGWLLFMVAALRPTVAELRRGGQEELSVVGLALPYAPLILAAVTSLIVQLVTGSFEPFLVYTGTMLGLLVMGRQIVDVAEHRHIALELQSELQRREQELTAARGEPR
jgi:hypothetical protein